MKKSSKKGLKIAAITVGCIALAVAAGFGTYRIKNRIDSKKYNLITLDTSSLPAPQEPVRDDFVQLKNVRMHYVVYGSGEQPLVLIHGNGGSAKSLAEAASYLANDYTVYVIESRCHGQSSDPGTIDYESMADDTAQFIAAMKLRKPYIMGACHLLRLQRRRHHRADARCEIPGYPRRDNILRREHEPQDDETVFYHRREIQQYVSP